MNVPSYLLLSTTGLSINDESIRIAKLRRSIFDPAVQLIKQEKISLAPGIIQAGYVQDQEKFKEILKDLARRHKVALVHATLPEERVYLFTAVIDKIPEEGIRDAVAFILEENVPLQLGNAVFDFDVVGEPEPNKLKVVVSVISKRVVDFYTQVLREAGIAPVSFDVESQAIARAVIPMGEKNAQLIINLSERKTGFYVVEDKVVQFSTTLPLANAGSLKAEIRKILGFWSSRNGREIKKVLLAGVGATDERIIKELKELKTEYPLSFSLADPWREKRALIDYAAAIGSALSGIRNFKFKLLAEEAKVEAVREYRRRRATVILTAAAFSLVIGLVGSFPAYALSRANKLEMTERVRAAGILPEDKNGAEAVLWLKEAEERLAILAPSLDKDRPGPFSALLSVRPAGVKITNFSWSKESKEFAVSGRALDRQALLDFENRLNSSGKFEETRIPLSSIAQSRNAPFSIKLISRQP